MVRIYNINRSTKTTCTIQVSLSPNFRLTTSLLVFMIFWNYRLCITTLPGSVPPGWRPNMTALENMEVKKGSHGPRYCKTCEHYKPPRGMFGEYDGTRAD